MKKKIVIIGAGLSGLSALHYLSQKDFDVRLLEKENFAGGAITTVEQNDFRYEAGPNGFLDNKSGMSELVSELGLKEKLLPANPQMKLRYICSKDKLYAFPGDPVNFFRFPLLTPQDKFKIVSEFLVKPQRPAEKTVHEFSVQHFGESTAKFFFDPLMAGTWGGNSRELDLRSCFPKIAEIEENYGSVIKGLFLEAAKNKTSKGLARLWSFEKGMGEIINALFEKYRAQIQLNTNVGPITFIDRKYRIQTDKELVEADHLIVATPAYAAARLVNSINKSLSETLLRIPYNPITVVGLGYTKKAFSKWPDGFGYLRPVFEGNEVLGVIFSSNIFKDRAPDGKRLVQVMLRGNSEEFISKAKEEIKKVLGAQEEPVDIFVKSIPQAIPQYTPTYALAVQSLQNDMKRFSGLHFCANYLGGISVNDCVNNAKKLAESL